MRFSLVVIAAVLAVVLFHEEVSAVQSLGAVLHKQLLAKKPALVQHKVQAKHVKAKAGNKAPQQQQAANLKQKQAGNQQQQKAQKQQQKKTQQKQKQAQNQNKKQQQNLKKAAGPAKKTGAAAAQQQKAAVHKFFHNKFVRRH